jgi:hypothetical protein
MKTLFVDYDFAKTANGAATRSKFLVRSLLEKGGVDLLIINSEDESSSRYKQSGKVRNVFHIKSEQKRKYLVPDNYNSFSMETMLSVLDIVNQEQYTHVVFRFYVHEELAEFLSNMLNDVNIVIDVDLLFSKFCLAFFKNKPTIKNRYYLSEYVKLKRFEKKVFAKDYTFLFSNREEMELVKSNNRFHWVVNPMIKNTERVEFIEEKYVLFYGNLNSSVMKKSFDDFISKVYPKIVNTLDQLGVKVHVIGKGDTSYYDKILRDKKISHVNLLGEVKNIKKFIKSSELVIFPISSFGGTLTRIMEVVDCKVPIVATKSVVAPLSLERYIPCSDDFDIFSRLVNLSLGDQARSSESAKKCYDYVAQEYCEETILKKVSIALSCGEEVAA